MATEHDLTRKIRDELAMRRLAGQPVHGLKVHGSQFVRDHPDWLFTVGGQTVVIETKKPLDPSKPPPRSATGHRVTAGQAVELSKYQRAGAVCAVVRSMEELRVILDRTLHQPLARGPILSVEAWMAQ